MAVAGGPNIVEDGLVFAVDFANKKSHVSGSTVVNDLIGSNDGTVTNGPVYDNGALDFDGNDDYVDFGSIDSSNPMSFYGITNMALEFWVYPEDSGDPYQRIMDKSNSGNGAAGWCLLIGNTPPAKRIGFPINSVYTINTTADTYDYQAWNQIVIVRSGTSFKLFTNGVEVSTATSNVPFPDTTTNMRIGTWNHGAGREFNGKIGTIRAYHKALTASEVLQNYNATKGRFGL